MASFTIINHITQREYVTATLRQFFFRPVTLLVCGWALLTFVLYLLSIVGLLPNSGILDASSLMLPLIFFIFIPLMIFLTASQQYRSSAKMRQLVEYTFNEGGVSYKGDNFEGKYDWNIVLRIKDKGDFLLLYHNRTNAEYIRKERLSATEIAFIKERVTRR